MNYKEVLENQVKQLEAVQERLVDLIVNQNAGFTSKVLNSMMGNAERIESLVNSIVNIEKETVTNRNSNGQE